ncbi:hypothetical protein AAC387_Pa07g2075 [Persea americana]
MYCFHALQYFQEVMELPLLLQTTVVVGGLISLRTYMIELEDWKAAFGLSANSGQCPLVIEACNGKAKRKLIKLPSCLPSLMHNERDEARSIDWAEDGAKRHGRFIEIFYPFGHSFGAQNYPPIEEINVTVMVVTTTTTGGSDQPNTPMCY